VTVVSDHVHITVPLVPPSVNHYKMRTRKGVTFVSAEAKAYKEAVFYCARGQKVVADEYAVGIRIFLGKKGNGDVDNFAKCVLDGLTDAGVIHSDAAIQRLTIEKFRDWESPRTEIVVEAK
jgi:crossover junction endodeoxyribonuclease RusA